MHALLYLGAAVLLASCSVPDPDGQANASTAVSAWPSDPDAAQLTDSRLASAPICRAAPIQLHSDSLGPLRPDLTLEAVLQLCPNAEPVWDWGDEALPVPALVLRLGGAAVSVTLSDTIRGSRVLELTVYDSTARTQEGLGVGSAFADLLRAYGQVTLFEGECIVEAVFDAEPALVWRLNAPEGTLECEAIPQIAEGQRIEQIPPGTRIQSVRLIRSVA